MFPETVAGRGIPGDTSTGVLIRLADYKNLQPNRVLFLFGTNDISVAGARIQLQENQAKICSEARSIWPNAIIMMVTPPLVSDWIEDAEEVNLEMRRYHEHLRSSSNDFQIVDMSEIWNENGYLKRDLTSDGIHLNSKGYSALLARLSQM